jgi:hypothetical protein
MFFNIRRVAATIITDPITATIGAYIFEAFKYFP